MIKMDFELSPQTMTHYSDTVPDIPSGSICIYIIYGVCIYLYTYTYTYTHISIHVNKYNVHVHICQCIDMCQYNAVCIYDMYIHSDIIYYLYIYIHTYIFIHVNKDMSDNVRYCQYIFWHFSGIPSGMSSGSGALKTASCPRRMCRIHSWQQFRMSWKEDAKEE